MNIRQMKTMINNDYDDNDVTCMIHTIIQILKRKKKQKQKTLYTPSFTFCCLEGSEEISEDDTL